MTVSKDVEAFCLERGARKNYRIVLAGYRDEYRALIDANWNVEYWSANGGYGNQGKKDNRHMETLFYSPYCRNRGPRQIKLC